MASEVLIIGGGVIGLSIARSLVKKGVREIAVVDRGKLGSESSWAAAGMLAPNIEIDSTDAFHRFGIDSLAMYQSFAAELRYETGIDIELDRSGTISVSFDEREEVALVKTFERQRRRGVHVELLTGEQVRELEPSISHAAGTALLYPDDWQVDNRKLIDALRRFAKINGVVLIEDTEVSELLTRDLKVTGARAADRDLLADTTVLATGAWTSLIKIRGVSLPIDVKPVRGQMISFQTAQRRLHHVVYSTAGYIVPRADGRVLVGATVEDVGFEKAVTQKGLESLVLAALEIMPSLSNLSVADRWSGLRPFADDGLPLIGEVPGYDALLVATAHYRNGILLAPKTADVVSEKIVCGGDSIFSDEFKVARFASTAANASAP